MKLWYLYLCFKITFIALSNSIRIKETESESSIGQKDFIMRDGEYPWHVGIWMKKGLEPFCGGAIIANRFVLTSAQCLLKKKFDDVKVVVGDHDIRKRDQFEDHIIACEFFSHQEHSGIGNDIAIIRICRPIDFTHAKIQPISLPPPYRLILPSDGILTVTGWGTLNQNTSPTPLLQGITVKNLPASSCLKADINGETHICASIISGNTCQMDRGGPVVWMDPDDNKMILVGVVAEKGCRSNRSNIVFTRVVHYFNWILHIMSQKP